ncbi:MAG: TetR/AcrR family transcriptional regulator [Coriobacteriia bacterium]|nr:TetR/AcrR family transcriptional regulator [Coriobacteriia bacterium]
MSDITGTKALIFDTFVHMTSTLGFENVSMREIAMQVGINPASIYYHFENKLQILEFAYDYYDKHQYDNRTPVDEIKKIINTADADEIVESLRYDFVTDDERQYIRMVLITKIIYMRLYQDPLANKMFADLNTSSVEYMLDILKYGVQIGRIDPEFDIETYAAIFVGSIHIMGIKSFASPDYQVAQLVEEQRIQKLLGRLLATALR